MEQPDLDGFTFERVIGRGGTATVYLAVQAPFDRQVAIKIYQGQITDDQARRVFEKECSAIGRLSARQGIAAFHAAGFLQDGAPYLVMQYYPKGSLASRVQAAGPLEVGEVMAVARRIGRALTATHAAGIVHRDVKPENMLIDDDDEPVLADFGISAIGDVASSRSVLAFSPSHVAPEVLEGGRAGESADLYSLASSLYMLLEGHAPFDASDGGHPGAMLVRVLQQDPPAFTRSDIPPGLSDLIMRSLAKSPAQRPSSMVAFLDEMELAEDPSPKPANLPSVIPVAVGSSDGSPDELIDGSDEEATVLRSLAIPNDAVSSGTFGVTTPAKVQGPLEVANRVDTASDPQDLTVIRSDRPGNTLESPHNEGEASSNLGEDSPRKRRRRLLISATVVALMIALSVAGAALLQPKPQVVGGCKIEPGTDCPGADLSGANLKGVDLDGARFQGARLVGANLSGANLNGTKLDLATLAGADLTDADLAGAQMGRTNLSGANLNSANMMSGILLEANLSGANLTNANLTGSNLTGADLTGAIVTGVVWSNTTCPDDTNSSSTYRETCIGDGI